MRRHSIQPRDARQSAPILRGRWAFTIIELLVVIGVIAVLLSILLPTLSHVRAMADTARCLSNFKQIGAAIAHYSNEHEGCLVPGDYLGLVDSYPSRGFGSWADILINGKYIAAPQGAYGAGSKYSADPGNHDNILGCPNGQDIDAASSGYPTSLTDGKGTFFSIRGSDLDGDAVKCWLGINCIARPRGWSFTAQDRRLRPFNFLPDFLNGRADSRINRIAQFDDSTRLPLVFDGVWCFLPGGTSLNYCINARHNNHKYTNILFADFHCETQESASLPNEDWYLK